ncbi:hypothetical protein KAFR_0F00310 [Kazachstania africana CBS 2517]|uniref:SUR7 family protein FMP45 n=1 Tax=Kazachstania africana (strain ATCC 22294 / BCRC 22015 / CBS 2517 / CECT 1963 / NBRC 1671 / NRRL Y-8276) TaxID=1071382 RepID=H2AW78_KAZAF|nr:hypothetical protein KAFR_0F00310 [Kazachstania africana CBS 2517]CCF58628.1 hypothetical protein KAFR_0F00310 [Kazachstania africana CBS 2517]
MLFKRLVNALMLLLLLGAGLLSFFIILSGARTGGTLKNFYWFQANTQGFNSAPSVTRWYNYDFCGFENNNVGNCSHKAPAKPFSPRDNFGSSPNMPSTFLNNRNTYYYLSRVAWAMLLIGFFFLMLTIIPTLVGIFTIIKGLAIFTTVMSWLAFFFMILAACLYTGCYVKARKAFHNNHRSAKLGAKNFAFIWTTVFLLLLNTIWSTFVSATHKGKKYSQYEEPEVYNTYPPASGDTTQYFKQAYARGATDVTPAPQNVPQQGAQRVAQQVPQTTYARGEAVPATAGTTQKPINQNDGKYFTRVKKDKYQHTTDNEPTREILTTTKEEGVPLTHNA